MNCPLCVERRLEPIIVDGVEIDVCENCGGVWLDRGELERMSRQAPTETGPTGRTPDSPRFDHPRDGAPGGKQKKPKKQKSLGARLGDLLEEALDL